jgi:hypothetical protein
MSIQPPTHKPVTALTHTRVRTTSRDRQLHIDVLAYEAGLAPELVRRFVMLGLLDTPNTSGTATRVSRGAPARLARAARLRRVLGVNCAGAVLACDLLERIDALEARLRRYEPDPR